jgi:Flp pilus assembly protein TadG
MLHSFFANRSGNFAIITALLSVPLVAAVGLAVDYTSASAQRQEMHNASDGAALAIARAGQNVNLIQAKIIAEDFIEANYTGVYSGLDVSKTGETWSVTLEAEADSSFANIIGVEKMPITVISSATFALKTYEIGLVLDTTGSMEGEKLAKLKEAATTLVDTMATEVGAQGRAGTVKFSLVPFSTFVNVGPEHGPKFNSQGKLIRPGAAWLDLKGKSKIPQVELEKGLSRFELFNHLGEEWAGCVETRQPTKKFAYDVTDLPATKKQESLFVPAFSIDEPDDKAGGRPLYPNSYLGDEGTTLDRSAKKDRLKKKYKVELLDSATSGSGDDDDDDDEDDDDDDGDSGLVGGLLGTVGVLSDAVFGATPAVDDSASTFYGNMSEPKGPNFDCVSEPILPLTDDYEDVKERIDSLVAKGSTNLLEGVAWGWRVLSADEPFAQGRPKSDANNEKIMIFLTDGANTWTQMPKRSSGASNQLKSGYSSFGYLVDERLVDDASTAGFITQTMDSKTETTCTNSKQDGVTIYTIRLELKDSGTGNMLKRCASSPKHYFDVPDASDLEEVFQEIANRIRQVRITS